MVPKAMRAARQKGRKGERHVIKIKKKKKTGKRQRDTAGNLRKKTRTRRGRKEGDKVGEKDRVEKEGIGREGILEAREKPCCSLMA